MKIRHLLTGALLAGAMSTSFAAAPQCTRTVNWSTLGANSFSLFANVFDTAGSYLDCYTFSMGSSANAFGGTLKLDPSWNQLDLSLNSASLYAGTSLVGSDASPSDFSFSGLAGGGLYTLAISSTVTSKSSQWTSPVGYIGALTTIAAPVPEPGSVGLMLAGLAGVGLLVARRRRV